jgi:hypothetical protein
VAEHVSPANRRQFEERPAEDPRAKQRAFALYRFKHSGATWAEFEAVWPAIRDNAADEARGEGDRPAGLPNPA